MELLVRRDRSDDKCVSGELLVNGLHAGWTLEPPYRPANVKPRAIPAGIYAFTVAWSKDHGRFLPLVLGVPDFEGIEIHIGNFPKDTLGCLLVGETRREDCVLSSSAEFTQLYSQIEAAFKAKECLTITYEDLVVNQEPPVAA